MYKFISQIPEVAAVPKFRPNSVRNINEIKRIVVHRLGPMLGGRFVEDATQVAEEFVDTQKYAAGSYTGGKQPYHFIMNPKQGVVYQALPLSANALHAGKYNRKSVGVAILQDMRHHPLHPNALCALEWFLAKLYNILYMSIGRCPDIKGHTELPGASSDPKKDCPGVLLDMNSLRSNVLELV